MLIIFTILNHLKRLNLLCVTIGKRQNLTYFLYLERIPLSIEIA